MASHDCFCPPVRGASIYLSFKALAFFSNSFTETSSLVVQSIIKVSGNFKKGENILIVDEKSNDLANTFKSIPNNKILKEGDIIFLHESHHGFKIIKDCSIIEIKQGPYIQLADKVLFNKTDENKIKYK